MQKSGGLNLKEQFSIIRRIIRYLGPKKLTYLLGGFMAALEMFQALAMPYLYQRLIRVVSSRSITDVYITLGLLASLLLLAPIICWGAYLQMTGAAFATSELRKSVFAHIQRLPLSAAMDQKSGDYLTILMSDVQRTGQVLRSFGITSLFRFAVLFSFSLFMLLLHNWHMAVLSVTISAVSFCASVMFTPRARALDLKAQEFTARTSSFLIETLRAMPVVRIFLLQERFSHHYAQLCRIIQQKRVKYRTINGMVNALVYMLQYIAQPLGFLFGIHLFIKGEVDMASLVYLAGLVGVMADSVKSLSTFIALIQQGLVSGTRVFALLDTPKEPERTSMGTLNLSAPFAVEFEDVKFSYESGRAALEDFTLCIQRGETIALVGKSGAGKSTVIKLLQGFYLPSSGRIKLFGCELSALSLADIRGLCAYVSQDIVLFNSTIAENIELGKPGSDAAAIEDAARKANIHEFIMSLPDKYNTCVAERGSNLSGGQKQRIAIARAILKNAPILILDEATSALDAESEKEVTGALGALMAGRTCIIITHHLSLAKNSDRTIFIENGHITQSDVFI